MGRSKILDMCPDGSSSELIGLCEYGWPVQKIRREKTYKAKFTCLVTQDTPNSLPNPSYLPHKAHRHHLHLVFLLHPRTIYAGCSHSSSLIRNRYPRNLPRNA